MSRKLLSLVFGASLAFTGTALAQNYPNRPLTMIVPFAAGGPQDTISRIIGQRLGEILQQQIIIENIGGAGGGSGSKRVADATPDGYTFGIGSVGTHAQAMTLYKKPLYNAATDFTPVALMAETPIALTVRKDLPVNNFKEFVQYAQANHGKMQFGSAGTGSATHLGCVVLNSVLKINPVHVPYRGTGPAMQDLHGGRIDYLCEIINTAKPHIEAGAIKGLAIMTKERSPVLPNLPTALEQGTPNLEAYTWSAVFFPKGVPDAIVKRMNAAVIEALDTPSVREKLLGSGAQIVSKDRMTPQYLDQFVKDEIVKWAAPIKASGATAE
jgi:tripartite-type tricarboxylate transporter receptor subunit TctC